MKRQHTFFTQITKTMKTVIFFVFAICTLYLNAQTPDQVLYHLDNTIENVATSGAN